MALPKEAIVEWLEWLGDGAESCQMGVSSRLGSPSEYWKTLTVDPAVNGYLFQIREGYGRERSEMGSTFHLLFPRYSGTLIPTAPQLLWLPLPFGHFMRTNGIIFCEAECEIRELSYENSEIIFLISP